MSLSPALFTGGFVEPDQNVIVCIQEKYSNKANPQRGYHDYITTVEGNVGRLETYFKAEFDRLKSMSMWCSSTYEKTGIVTGRYTIKHGYDSGD